MYRGHYHTAHYYWCIQFRCCGLVRWEWREYERNVCFIAPSLDWVIHIYCNACRTDDCKHILYSKMGMSVTWTMSAQWRLGGHWTKVPVLCMISARLRLTPVFCGLTINTVFYVGWQRSMDLPSPERMYSICRGWFHSWKSTQHIMGAQCVCVWFRVLL